MHQYSIFVRHHYYPGEEVRIKPHRLTIGYCLNLLYRSLNSSNAKQWVGTRKEAVTLIRRLNKLEYKLSFLARVGLATHYEHCRPSYTVIKHIATGYRNKKKNNL